MHLSGTLFNCKLFSMIPYLNHSLTQCVLYCSKKLNEFIFNVFFIIPMYTVNIAFSFVKINPTWVIKYFSHIIKQWCFYKANSFNLWHSLVIFILGVTRLGLLSLVVVGCQYLSALTCIPFPRWLEGGWTLATADVPHGIYRRALD